MWSNWKMIGIVREVCDTVLPGHDSSVSTLSRSHHPYPGLLDTLLLSPFLRPLSFTLHSSHLGLVRFLAAERVCDKVG